MLSAAFDRTIIIGLSTVFFFEYVNYITPQKIVKSRAGSPPFWIPGWLFTIFWEHDVLTYVREVIEMKQLLRRLWNEQEGQDLTEYGLVLVLIALAAIASMQTLASAINGVFSTAAANLSGS